ncbi:MAG: 30S ribosomal protein S14 [Rickettsiales bacterium]|nr:30S ribosomal protein S14 [Rickettsiales bacterium]|tara:strand:- start:10748 stop:11053 length:306 start_codon:yes stop_codon:yes gene_type:complete
MAKVSSIQKNLNRKKLVARDESKRAALKDIVMNRSLAPDERFKATIKLSKLPRNGARIRIRNRCELTGRARGYYRKLGLSRIALRQLSSEGQVPGMTKSSW